MQGTCLEEAVRIEEFFDTAKARVEWLANRHEVTERRFANHGVPWDRSVVKAARHASLHLGVIFMSRYFLVTLFCCCMWFYSSVHQSHSSACACCSGGSLLQSAQLGLVFQ